METGAGKYPDVLEATIQIRIDQALKNERERVLSIIYGKTKEITKHIEELQQLREPIIDRLGEWSPEESEFMLNSVQEIVNAPTLINLLREIREAIIAQS